MVHLLGAEGVGLEFPTRVVFDAVTVGIDEGDRIGVVGRNGDGKSSLLAMLAGRLEPDSGRVTVRGGIRVGVLDQADTLDDALTIRQSVVGDRPEHEWAGDSRTREVIANPRHPHTAALTAAFPVIGDPAHRWAEPAPEPQPLLEVRDLAVDYGRTRAVDGVDLTVGRGEIVALVGQSGSGKTTLARTIMGLRKPSSGRVIFDGVEVPRNGKALKAFRRQVQLVLQDPASALNPRHKVHDAVAEGLRVHGLDQDEESQVTAAVERA